ncbi:Metallophosphoesterase 1, partial [Globisporangium splendens]
MGILHELVGVVAVICFAQVGVFYLYAATTCRLDRHDGRSASTDLRALVVSDVHLLGKRRRSWVERAWIDWQSAVDVHQPDLVLVLGDQFDEGGLPTPQSDWAVGNHDTAFGRYMQIPEMQRFEQAFGPSNRIEFIGGHAFVVLNTMALDSDVVNEDVKAQAIKYVTPFVFADSKKNSCMYVWLTCCVPNPTSFLDSIDHDRLRARTANGSIVLLTHLPLYRTDDLRCGDARVRESGHVTYEHPAFKYAAHHHVLSQELSSKLLRQIQPSVVLSGHTHAWCAYDDHWSGTKEFTVPAFSWGQRPDPSYVLLRLRSHQRVAHTGESEPHVEAEVAVLPCAVPREGAIFALYILTAVAFVAANARRWLLRRNARRVSAPDYAKTD